MSEILKTEVKVDRVEKNKDFLYNLNQIREIILMLLHSRTLLSPGVHSGYHASAPAQPFQSYQNKHIIGFVCLSFVASGIFNCYHYFMLFYVFVFKRVCVEHLLGSDGNWTTRYIYRIGIVIIRGRWTTAIARFVRKHCIVNSIIFNLLNCFQ